MRKWSTTTRLLFLTAASVYSIGAIAAAAETPASAAAGANSASAVRLLDETSGPVAADKDASSAAPIAPAPKEGQSLGKSEVNVSDTGGVEIHVSEASLTEVLRMLSLQAQKNIVASKDVRGTVTANLYNVTIREALDALLKANGFGYREKGNFIYVYSARELAEIDKTERHTNVEVFRLYYTPVADMVNMVKPILSKEGEVAFTKAAAVGIDSATKDAGGNSLATEDVIVVRDYPENIDRVRKLVKDVDRRPQQILVEATIVAARLTDNNSLGIDFNVVGGVDFASVLHENGQITSANLPKILPVPDDNANSTGTGNNFTSPLKSGFKVGFVSSNVSVFLNALEEVTDTYVLGNPKVLTLNKQRGEVLVGREDGYLTTTVTESTAVQSVEFLKTGTKLIFRPFIGDDGFIRMEVHPEDSDGKVVNGLPSKTTTEITSNVMVKDGHTIIIGGLFRESTTVSRNQIPVLGNLPLVGFLFRNQTDNSIREEVIILLTPHIVKDLDVYGEASDKMLKDAERMRVGIRRGMMPWGRERMAECSYDKAVAEMNSRHPSRSKALWHLDCAINLNPKFLEAIKMKESLTGKEVTGVDNSAIRGFVRTQILSERGVQTSPATPRVEIPVIPTVDVAAQPEAQVPAEEPTGLTPAIEATVATPAAQPADATATTPLLEPSESATATPTPATQPTEPQQTPTDVVTAPTEEVQPAPAEEPVPAEEPDVMEEPTDDGAAQ